MLSVATAQQSEINSAIQVRRSHPAMPSAPKQEPTPPHQVKLEDGSDRGRIRNRSETKDADGFENDDALDGDADGQHANSSNSEGGPARKRRRSRKGLDKKFECPEKGCGKSYSRAEHLYGATPVTARVCDPLLTVVTAIDIN
jgi:hypothetical protein